MLFGQDLSVVAIEHDTHRKLRSRGLKLNPSFSGTDPSDDRHVVEFCSFCKQPLKEEIVKQYQFSLGEYLPCDCAENKENTATYQAAFEEEAAPMLTKAKQQRVERLLEASNMPTRWKKRTFDDFIVNNTNRKAYEAAVQYAIQFTRGQGDGLLLSGTVGTGKTHLAAAVAMALMENEYKVVLGTVNGLLSEIRYSYNDERAESEAKLFEKYTTCDLLVIDDLGKERVSDWTEQMVFDIVNTRYEQCKSLVVTTNLSLQEIKMKYRDNGEALADRLLEMCRGLKLEGESWRRKAIG